jgi:hypothetical protein
MTKDAERSTKASVAASRTPENSVNVKFAEILLCVSRVNATKAEPQATLAVAPFGLGPYRLLPGVLSNKANTKSTIPPISGTNPIRIHQPVRSMSWSLLTVTAKVGMRTARL